MDEEKAEKKSTASPAKKFFSNPKVQAVIIICVSFAVMFGGLRNVYVPPGPPPPFTDTLIAMNWVVEVESALIFGVGVAWTILMAIRISKDISPVHQRPAWVSYVAISYILLADWFHGKSHAYVGPEYNVSNKRHTYLSC